MKEEQLRKLQQLSRVLNNKTNAKILNYITIPKTVTEIYIRTRIDQSSASTRLKQFRKIGLVRTVRKGKHVYYKINKQEFYRLENIINQL